VPFLKTMPHQPRSSIIQPGLTSLCCISRGGASYFKTCTLSTTAVERIFGRETPLSWSRVTAQPAFLHPMHLNWNPLSCLRSSRQCQITHVSSLTTASSSQHLGEESSLRAARRTLTMSSSTIVQPLVFTSEGGEARTLSAAPSLP